MARGLLRTGVGLSALTLVAAGAVASPFPASAGLVEGTVWDCTNGDVLTFALPAAAISPGAGATVAPFPGILTGVDTVGIDQPTPSLGTYLVLGIVTSDGTINVGTKTGLAAGALTCTLEGTNVTVVIAPAAH